MRREIPRLVSTLLLLLLTMELARLGLALRGADASTAAPAGRPAPTAGTPGHAPSQVAAVHGRPTAVDIEPIVAAHLFGTPAATLQDPEDAPASTAPLVLAGTIIGADHIARAIIDAEGTQRVYKVGDDVGGVALRSIYRDRVVLNREGKLETLRLPHVAAAPPAGIDRPPPTTAQAAAEPPSRPPWMPDPDSLANLVRVKAKVDDSGRLRGFVMHPNAHFDAFAAAGLEQNDLVTAVNGTPLVGQDPASGQAVVNAMLQSAHSTLTIERRGRPMDLTLGGPQ